MKKQQIKKTYPKIDLKRQRGFPFVMAFVYAPGGTVVYTGDLGTIQKHLSGGPTCHGRIVYYMKGIRYPQTRVNIFGKGAFAFRKQNYLSFEHLSKRNVNQLWGGFQGEKDIAADLDDRKKHILIEHFGLQRHVLGKWRNLPKTYLPVFKEYDGTTQ
jgi:hypothetical protein